MKTYFKITSLFLLLVSFCLSACGPSSSDSKDKEPEQPVLGALAALSTWPSSEAETSSHKGGQLSKAGMGLPVPPGLEARVHLWETVYADYESSHQIIYNRRWPQVIYEAFRDMPGEKDQALARIRSRLYTLDRITRNFNDPEEEMRKSYDGEGLLRLYSLFRGIEAPDKFRVSASYSQIGIARGRRGELIRAYKRAAPYLPEMESIFRERGLPPELTRIVFVESMFNRDAVSSKDAVGVWQILEGSARPYLIMNQSIDERRDPVKSSRAAARILENNYETIGDWPLAVTAYNAGINRVIDACRTTDSSSLPEVLANYEHRSFGEAVENFYARFMGILRAEKKLGLPESTNSTHQLDPLEYDLVKLPKAYPLSELARKLGMSKSILIKFNPSWTEAVESEQRLVPRHYLLRVPQGSEDSVRFALGIAPGNATTVSASNP